MNTEARPFSFTFLLEIWGEKLEHLEQWAVRNSMSLFLCGLGIAASAAVFCLMIFLCRKILVPRLRRKHPAAASAVDGVIFPASFFLFLAGLSMSLDLVRFPGRTGVFLDKIIDAMFIVIVLNGMLRAIHGAGDVLLAHFQRRNPASYSMNKLLMDLSRSLLKLAAWCVATVFILQDVFGWKITALLASAGILGLAIAFAAQNTIANLFGAFSILGSKLFVVGDWIKVDDAEGIVEQIGFRSVRIRAFEGRLIDVPNRLIADSRLENYSNRSCSREHFCYGLVYQTDMEQLRTALRILDDIGRDLAPCMVPGRPPRFTFLTCGSVSLDLDGYVWFNTADWFEMRDLRGRFNQEVVERFTKAGLSFAYPTTTVYLAGDGDSSKHQSP